MDLGASRSAPWVIFTAQFTSSILLLFQLAVVGAHQVRGARWQRKASLQL